MTDPEPPDRDIQARLLRAGMRETPPSGTLQRTLTGLGLGAGAIATVSSAGAIGAAKAAAPLTAIGLTKWAGLGVAGGIMLSATTYGVHRATRPATQPASSAVVAPPVSPPPTAVPNPVTREPVEESTPALTRPTAPPSPATVPAPAAHTELPLATEVAFVDRAREAFQRGDSGAALRLLQSYEPSFTDRRLMPEVLYLRMRAHSRMGDDARAAQVAERLLRDFPKSPHASSARALLSGTPVP
jgi:hypothetical protein